MKEKREKVEVRGRLKAPTHLHPGVNAHVLEKCPLGDWSQAGHARSRRLPEVAEVHVGGEVSCPRQGEYRVELVTFESLSELGVSTHSFSCSSFGGVAEDVLGWGLLIVCPWPALLP